MDSCFRQVATSLSQTAALREGILCLHAMLRLTLAIHYDDSILALAEFTNQSTSTFRDIHI